MDALKQAQERIAFLEQENNRLRHLLFQHKIPNHEEIQKNGKEHTHDQENSVTTNMTPTSTKQTPPVPFYCAMEAGKLRRYSRQMILEQFGSEAQKKLLDSTVLIVGAGGLGCPAALYLAGAGIGKLILVDHDHVDMSNLHRQIAHTEQAQDVLKVESLATAIHNLNSHVKVEVHAQKFSACNGKSLAESADVVLDATDNPATRYLINDACVLASKPLVSGAALGLHGQLSVYNYNNGPCYRCLYPSPPPSGSVASCADNGVLGPVPGMIGVLQALETIKVITGIGKPMVSRLLVWDAADALFRVVKLRGKQQDCASCGTSPSITQLQDSETFCACSGLITDEQSSNEALELLPHMRQESLEQFVSTYNQTITSTPTVIDVRSKSQYQMCHLNGSLNIPLKEFELSERIAKKNQENVHDALARLVQQSRLASKADETSMTKDASTTKSGLTTKGASTTNGASKTNGASTTKGASTSDSSSTTSSIPNTPSDSSRSPSAKATMDDTWHVICRRGVDSMIATSLLRTYNIDAVDVKGGLSSYHDNIDATFPKY